MAKLEKHINASFSEVITAIQCGILQGSASAELEDSSDYTDGAVRCAVRVFERYSVVGGNRVSLSVTLVGQDGKLFLSAIASGGSQAMLFKINTFGEEAFLNCLGEVLKDY